MDSENVNNNEDFSKLIYVIRGVKVMLDADLAAIYGYTTKAFNQQVKNNVEKFDYDFRFQLTKEEYENLLRSKNLTSKFHPTNCESSKSEESIVLRSKNLTSNLGKQGGRQYLPYVFTEQGIYMLMTVLKGDLAIEQSKALIRTFKRISTRLVASFMTDTSSSTMQLVMSGYFTAVHRQKMPETK